MFVSRFEPAGRHDVDSPAENSLQLIREVHEIEEGTPLLELHEKVDAVMGTSTTFGLPPASSQEFAQLVEELAQETAPRRFALCEVDSETPDARVFAWGLADSEEAVVVAVEEAFGKPWFGRFQSAERAQRLFSRVMECRLVWIDPARDEDEG